nr:putative nuclease HARBI1 [Neodiprion pinetum]
MDLIGVNDLNNFDNVDDIDALEEEGHNVVPLRVRRYIRDAQDLFEFYDETEFQRRYRFTKESVMYGILPKIEEGIARINNRGLPIAPVLQLLICLRYYATASFQLLLGDTHLISQPTISRTVYRVSLLIASLITEYIKFPASRAGQMENYRLFHDLGRGNGGIGLPCVDGAIDCTHIRLTSTRFQNIDEIHRNRKGYFSLNVQNGLEVTTIAESSKIL